MGAVRAGKEGYWSGRWGDKVLEREEEVGAGSTTKQGVRGEAIEARVIAGGVAVAERKVATVRGTGVSALARVGQGGVETRPR